MNCLSFCLIAHGLLDIFNLLMCTEMSIKQQHFAGSFQPQSHIVCFYFQEYKTNSRTAVLIIVYSLCDLNAYFIYIYIYIYVCVCVCVYVYSGINQSFKRKIYHHISVTGLNTRCYCSYCILLLLLSVFEFVIIKSPVKLSADYNQY